jgi:hypothetical protein
VSRRTGDALPSVTLDQIIRGEASQRPTRRQRYTLALILASSFLQLTDTQWLPAASWRKADIVFYSNGDTGDDVSGNTRHAIRLDRPHLSRSIGSDPEDDDNTTSSSAAAVGAIAQSLNQLGIVLLELCFGKPLEEQACRREWPAGGSEAERRGFDLLAARRWQYEVDEEAGADFSDAVGWCLGSQYRADRWRQEMLRQVVQPLQRCHDYLMGGGGRPS